MKQRILVLIDAETNVESGLFIEVTFVPRFADELILSDEEYDKWESFVKTKNNVRAYKSVSHVKVLRQQGNEGIEELICITLSRFKR